MTAVIYSFQRAMNTVLTVLVLLTALATLCMTAILAAGALAVRRKVRKLESSFQAFVSAPDAQTPSPFAQTVDAAAQVIARAAISQFRTTVNGMASGASRAEKSIAAQSAMAQFPWLSVLEKLSPGLSKTLIRNPQLLNLAAQFAASKAPAAPAAPSNGHTPTQAQFTL